MTARHDPDDLIRAFLGDGQTELPDRAFDAVRRDIHRTRQRAVIGPWREPDMSSLARVVIAAAAVVAVGFTWINFGPSQNGLGGAPAPTPTPTVAPSQSPPTVVVGALKPGRYAFGDAPLSAEVPAGWTGLEGGAGVTKSYGDLAGAELIVTWMSGTFVDPCTDHTLVKPGPGPGIDEWVDALASQPGTSATTPTDVIVDGFRGKVVDVTVTVDVESCGPDGFQLWASPSGGRRDVQDTGEINRIYIIDIEDSRLPFVARIPERTTAADRAELEAMIDSIDIQIH